MSELGVSNVNNISFCSQERLATKERLPMTTVENDFIASNEIIDETIESDIKNIMEDEKTREPTPPNTTSH